MSKTEKTSSSTSKPPSKRGETEWKVPTLRDAKSGWTTLGAFLYGLVADIVGLLLLLHVSKAGSLLSNPLSLVPLLIAGLVLSAHGRMIASYLIHEAAHHSIFVETWANEWFGNTCLWLAACPYADFDHIRKMHWAHHKDRADTVEFDYRDFVNKSGGMILKNTILALEWCFIPIVETIMHLRTAFYPIFYSHKCTPVRFRSAMIGVPASVLFYYFAWLQGILLPIIIQGTLLLHGLSLFDAFHHTFDAIFIDDPSYKPGPQGRTAQYEEDNTYSNLVSRKYPWLSILTLNFGYHNAHHKKPMVPWYRLPEWHRQLYGTDDTSKQEERNILMPAKDVVHAWFHHRLRRALEEDYGVVHPPGTPGRANDFVGALGVSFLTV